jgi:hypothetical protein
MNRDVRALTVGGVVVAVAWLGLRGVPGGSAAWRQSEARLAQQAELVARARDRVQNLDALGDSIRAMSAVADALPRLLLLGGDAGTASVDLMGRIRELTSAAPVRLTGFEPNSAGARSGPLTSAAVTVLLESDLQGLVTVLDRIDVDSVLAVEALDVNAVDPQADSGRYERLTAAIRVSGWFRPASDGAPQLDIPAARARR